MLNNSNIDYKSEENMGDDQFNSIKVVGKANFRHFQDPDMKKLWNYISVEEIACTEGDDEIISCQLWRTQYKNYFQNRKMCVNYSAAPVCNAVQLIVRLLLNKLGR